LVLIGLNKFFDAFMLGRAINEKEYESYKEKFQNIESSANLKINPLQKLNA
jgi:hypothetical protein